MTERQTRLWILGTSAAAGFSLGSAIMGIVDAIKDRRLERKIDRMRDVNCCNFVEIQKGHDELMEMFRKWDEENKALLDEAMKRTET